MAISTTETSAPGTLAYRLNALLLYTLTNNVTARKPVKIIFIVKRVLYAFKAYLKIVQQELANN